MMPLFQRYVLHNFTLKLLSLLLAAGLWMMIARDEQPAEVALHAPIVFKNVPQHLEISTELIPEAQIRLRGPERAIHQLQPNEIHAEIDLADVQPGVRTFDLTSQLVRHPREVHIVQVVPSQLQLTFDTRLTREVEIRPNIIGLADGEKIVKTDPPRIMITGPKRHVEKIDAATTDPIDATGAHGSAAFTTNAFVADPLVQVVQNTSMLVTVTVDSTAKIPSH